MASIKQGIMERLGLWQAKISLAEPPPPLNLYSKQARKVGNRAAWVFVITLVLSAWWALYVVIPMFMSILVIFSVEQSALKECNAEEQRRIIELSQSDPAVDRYRQAVVSAGRAFYKADIRAIEEHLDKVADETRVKRLTDPAPIFGQRCGE